jgi:hypothetical protein
VALCERGTGVRPPSRVPPSSFEGAARWPYESGWHSVTELTLASPHSVVQWQGWPHGGGGGLAEQRRDMTPRCVGGTTCVDSSSTWAPAGVRALNAPVGGAGTGGRARESFERGGLHPRGRPALERGGPHPRG